MAVFFCFVKSLLINGICMALLYVAVCYIVILLYQVPILLSRPFCCYLCLFCEILAAGSFVLCLTGVWLSVWFRFVPDILMFLHCMLGWDFCRPRPFLEISTRCQKKINCKQEHIRLMQLFPFMRSEEMLTSHFEIRWNWLGRTQHTHTQPFYGPFSGTTRVSRCQKRTCGLYGARED